MTKIEGVTWCGKPVAEMSQEELYAIILDMSERLNQAHRAHQHSLDVWKLAQTARHTTSF